MCFYLSEINKVRVSLFHINTSKEPLVLPDTDGGPVVSVSEKVFVPVKEYPDVSISIFFIFLPNWVLQSAGLILHSNIFLQAVRNHENTMCCFNIYSFSRFLISAVPPEVKPKRLISLWL